MASENQVKELIKNHERRISRLESLLLQRKPVKSSKENQKLPDHILDLRTKGFFSQPKTAGEAHQKLRGTYHCELDRVAMALLRLAERKQLRKASKVIGKKKYQAYVW
jgi:hypothetical protein